jgi:hypothetical protein
MGAEGSATLESVDSLTARVLDHLRPIDFRVARSAAERESTFGLRYRVAVEDGLAEPADLPEDGLEREPADDRAVLIGGWDGETLTATARLVAPEPGVRLPIEEELGITFEPPGEVVEWTRMAVAPEYRDPGHLHFFGLMCACWVEMRRLGHSVGAGAVTAEVLELYRRMGIGLTVAGPPTHYWNEERYPVRFDGATGAVATEKWASRVGSRA